MFSRISKNKYIPIDGTSDVDPDPVGSEFIWVRGSGSRGIKAEFNQQNVWGFFCKRLYFSSLNLK